MNDKVKRIIEVLSHHTDLESISVLEELGTNAADNEVRELTSQALVRKITTMLYQLLLLTKEKVLMTLVLLLQCQL